MSHDLTSSDPVGTRAKSSHTRRRRDGRQARPPATGASPSARRGACGQRPCLARRSKCTPCWERAPEGHGGEATEAVRHERRVRRLAVRRRHLSADLRGADRHSRWMTAGGPVGGAASGLTAARATDLSVSTPLGAIARRRARSGIGGPRGHSDPARRDLGGIREWTRVACTATPAAARTAGGPDPRRGAGAVSSPAVTTSACPA